MSRIRDGLTEKYFDMEMFVWGKAEWLRFSLFRINVATLRFDVRNNSIHDGVSECVNTCALFLPWFHYTAIHNDTVWGKWYSLADMRRNYSVILWIKYSKSWTFNRRREFRMFHYSSILRRLLSYHWYGEYQLSMKIIMLSQLKQKRRDFINEWILYFGIITCHLCA